MASQSVNPTQTKLSVETEYETKDFFNETNKQTNTNRQTSKQTKQTKEHPRTLRCVGRNEGWLPDALMAVAARRKPLHVGLRQQAPLSLEVLRLGQCLGGHYLEKGSRQRDQWYYLT